MSATKGLERSTAVPLRRRQDGAAAIVAVCRSLGSTLEALSRELDCLLAGNQQDVARELTRVRVLTDDLVRRLRTVRGAENEGSDPWSALLASLRRLGTDFARATGASVELEVHGGTDRLPEEVVEVLFAVACESFRSIERHARASVVLVVVSVRETAVILEMKDDGLDLAQREAYDWCGSTKAGVVTVAELLESVGGRLAVTSTSPRGLHLVAEVPCLPPVA